MARKAPLFDPDMMIDDIRVQGLSAMAQLFLFKIMALTNKAGDGYLRIGERVLDILGAAQVLRIEGDISALAQEIFDMGLLAEDGDGLYVPEIREAAIIRAKRSRAGKKGGEATTVKRSDVCLSNVISIEKSKRYKSGDKKKKEPKKKNKYNYIYIYRKKVFTGNRGKKSNPLWFTGQVIKFYRSEYEALLEVTGLDDDYLWGILTKQDEWLAKQPHSARINWLALTLGFIKKQFPERIKEHMALAA